MDQQKIGMFFRTLREEKHLTQEQLAEIIGVSNRTVSRWENGRNIPDLSIMMQLSVFYGVRMDEIVNGKRESEDDKVDEREKNAILQLEKYYRGEKSKFSKYMMLLLLLGCLGALGYCLCNNPELRSSCIGIMAGTLVTAFLIHGIYLYTEEKMVCPGIALGEKVMPATYKDNWSGIGGYLKLREDGLSFVAHDLNWRKEDLHFPFSGIDDMYYGKTFGITDLIVIKSEGREYKFLLGKADRREVLDAWGRSSR